MVALWPMGASMALAQVVWFGVTQTPEVHVPLTLLHALPQAKQLSAVDPSHSWFPITGNWTPL